MKRTKPATAKRKPLTKPRIVEAALKIVDAEGIEALSMRRLAKGLHIEAMSLYNHVESKQAVLTEILDEVFAAIDPPAPTAGAADWQGWLREWMRRAWTAFEAHPKLFQVLLSDPPLGPNALRVIEALFAKLNAAGFDGETQVRVWEVLKAFLFGMMLRDSLKPDPQAMPDPQLCCPHLKQLLPAFACCEGKAHFEFGLELLLAGLAPALQPDAKQRKPK